MDGQLIYIDQVKDDDKFDGNDPIELLGEEFFRERKVDNKRLKVDDLIELSQAIKEYVNEILEIDAKEGLALDYARAFISDVNWYSIAEHMRDTYELNDDENDDDQEEAA